MLIQQSIDLLIRHTHAVHTHIPYHQSQYTHTTVSAGEKSNCMIYTGAGGIIILSNESGDVIFTLGYFLCWFYFIYSVFAYSSFFHFLQMFLWNTVPGIYIVEAGRNYLISKYIGM